MIIIGHPWIESQSFRRVSSLSEIEASQPQEVLLLETLERSQPLAKYCHENKLSYAIEIASIKEAVFANALQASYLLCPKIQAKEIQGIAQEYLFDSRILVTIQSEEEIETLAMLGIDAVLFEKAIG